MSAAQDVPATASPKAPGRSSAVRRIGSFDPQAETTGGDSGDCWYTIRFPISTDRPVHEVLNHYRQARIEDPDGELGDFSVAAWALVDQSGDQAAGSAATGPVIIDVDGVYDGGLLDGRCS